MNSLSARLVIYTPTQPDTSLEIQRDCVDNPANSFDNQTDYINTQIGSTYGQGV